MKKTLFLLFLALGSISAKAQFTAGTKYIGASTTGLGMSYSANEKFRFGVDADAGYFVADGWMLKANAGYQHTRYTDDVHFGVGARYYFLQNGVFLGAGAEYDHFTKSSNDVMIPVEVGYAFYLNHYIAIEPSVYYKMSINDFSNSSTVGLRIGLGYFF